MRDENLLPDATSGQLLGGDEVVKASDADAELVGSAFPVVEDAWRRCVRRDDEGCGFQSFMYLQF